MGEFCGAMHNQGKSPATQAFGRGMGINTALLDGPGGHFPKWRHVGHAQYCRASKNDNPINLSSAKICSSHTLAASVAYKLVAAVCGALNSMGSLILIRQGNGY